MNWTGAEVLVTGGTGSLGSTLVRQLLDLPIKGIRVYSRDEAKHVAMKKGLVDKPIAWIIGDIRDRERLRMACEGVHYIINAAAMKRIEVCDADPLECVKTNITTNTIL